MPDALQLRLQEVEAQQHAESYDLDSDQAKFFRYCNLCAQIRDLEKERDSLKDYLKPKVEEGESIGHETAYLSIQPGQTATFQTAAAVMAGAITQEVADQFTKVTKFNKLVVKSRDQ